MAIESIFRQLFETRTTFKDITEKLLNKEQARLEDLQRATLVDARKHDKRRKELFDLANDLPGREKRVIAQKIADIDRSVRTLDAVLDRIAKQSKLVSSLISLKKLQKATGDSPLMRRLDAMGTDDVVKGIEATAGEGEFDIQRLTKIFEAADGAAVSINSPGDDADVDEVLRSVEDARKLKEDAARLEKSLKRGEGRPKEKGVEAPDPE